MKIEFFYGADKVTAELSERTIRVSSDDDTSIGQARRIESVLGTVLEARLGGQYWPTPSSWNAKAAEILGAVVLEPDPEPKPAPALDSKKQPIIY
jgi:hypothetical protein